MSKNQLARLIFLSIIGFSFFEASLKICFSNEPEPKASKLKDTVIFESSGLPVDWDSIPKNLASSLTTHPQTGSFRTDWTFSEGGGNAIGAVLYNRKLKILKYYERNLDSSGVTTIFYIYHGVTDNVIQKIRSDIENPLKSRNIQRNNSYFDSLRKYGIIRTGDTRYRAWQQKIEKPNQVNIAK